MDEEEARARLDVSHETFERLDAFVELLRQENQRQNLVSQSSLDHVWARHILDSAQLLRLAPDGDWIDLGTGAGFPGLIAAALRSNQSTTLVEARKLRVDFLRRAAGVLGAADRTTIVSTKVEAVPSRCYSVISARAFAPLDKLFAIAEKFSGEGTIWLLPKGRNAETELEAACASWQGEFRLEPSLTDPLSQIIVGRQIRRRAKGIKGR
jgi:16S rRNA (guanine527-N7)-methyltransferase